MRKLNQFMLLLMTLSLVSLSSCSSDDDSSGGSGGGGGEEFLTAKIDGSNYAAAQSPSVIVGAQSTNGVLAVQGGDNSGNTITITISNYTGVGSYVSGDSVSNQNGLQYLEISPAPATWASNFATLTPGTIEITSDNGTTVEGTFSFEGTDGSTTKVITNGEFKAKFD